MESKTGSTFAFHPTIHVPSSLFITFSTFFHGNRRICFLLVVCMAKHGVMSIVVYFLSSLNVLDAGESFWGAKMKKKMYML